MSSALRRSAPIRLLADASSSLAIEIKGFRGVRMPIGDKEIVIVGSINEIIPEAVYQRCTVQFYRNVLMETPKSRRLDVAVTSEAIRVMEFHKVSEVKVLKVVSGYEEFRSSESVEVGRGDCVGTLARTRIPCKR